MTEPRNPQSPMSSSSYLSQQNAGDMYPDQGVTRRRGDGSMLTMDGKPMIGAVPYFLKNTQKNLGPDVADWEAPDLDGGGGGGSYNAAAALQAMLSGIEESYGRQKTALDQNKATSASGIQNAYDQFKTNIGSNHALYQQGSQQLSQGIAQRSAQQLAEAQAQQKALQGSVGSVGGNVGAMQMQANGNNTMLQASQNNQAALGSRVDQIADFNQRASNNSGDLVRQGATGTLEGNYNAYLNQLNSQKEQQVLQANQSASSGGGGGGGGGGGAPASYADMLSQLKDKSALEDFVNGRGQSAGDIFRATMKSKPEAALALLMDPNNNAQALKWLNGED